VPRFQIAFTTKQDKEIRYNKESIDAKVLPPEATWIVERINEKFETIYDYVLINVYETKEHYISFHKDNETGLDKKQPIISLAIYDNIEETRTIRIKEKQGKMRFNIKQKHGDIITLSYTTNILTRHAMM